MENFKFLNPTQIVFGTNCLKDLAGLVRDAGGTKVLIHYGGKSAKKSGLLDEVKKLLAAGKIEFIELGGVVPNPRLQLCLEGAKLARAEGADFILALGGGSVIDSAKCLAAAYYHEDVWKFYMHEDEKLQKALPIGVVLTIPAAGSESSEASVITDEVSGLKRDIGAACLYPKFAAVNPKWTFSLPEEQISYGLSDILAHMMERYFTPSENVDFTNHILEGAMKSLMQNGVKAFSDKTNYDLRAEISLAAIYAHNGMFGVGRVGDWGSHMIEHELSATYDIAHGAGLAVVFPAWLKYMLQNGVGTAIITRFANEVMDAKTPERGIKKLEEFYARINLKIRLKDLGIDRAHFKEMSANALINRGTVGKLMKLKAEDIYKILELAE